jgi:hypothetical protein
MFYTVVTLKIFPAVTRVAASQRESWHGAAIDAGEPAKPLERHWARNAKVHTLTKVFSGIAGISSGL